MKRLLMITLAALSVAAIGLADQTVKTKTTYAAPATLTIQSGVPLLGTWTFASGSSIDVTLATKLGFPSGNAAGLNQQVQFNDSNLFAGDANFTWDKVQKRVTVNNAVTLGVASVTTAPPPAGGAIEGTLRAFNDSNVGKPGEVITAGGTFHVLGYFNGTNWVVSGASLGAAGTPSPTPTPPITVQPGGPNQSLQFNDNGTLGGIGTASYDKTTGAFTISAGGTAQSLVLSGSGAGVTIAGTGLTVSSIGSGVVKATAGKIAIATAGTDYEAALGNPALTGSVLSSSSGGVRSWIPPLSGGLMTVTSTTDQIISSETAHVSYTVAPGAPLAGATYHIFAWGNMDAGTIVTTFTPRLRWGATELIARPVIKNDGAIALTNRSWRIDAYVTLRTVGTSGSAVTMMKEDDHLFNDTGAMTSDQADTGSFPILVDTQTSANALALTWTLSTTTGSPHVRTFGGGIELVRNQ
jgi:hypothetical protein